MANGWRIHVQVATDTPGTGLPVVLLHGLSVSSRYLRPTAARLAADRGIYVPDLPGFGGSEPPPQALTIYDLPDTLAAWMRAMNLQQAALLGHSFGCQILAELALRHSERLAQAVFVAPTVEPQERTAIRQIARLRLDAFREPPALLPIVLYEYLRAGVGRTVRTLQYALQDPIERKLPQVRVPSLVIRGAHDPLVSQRWAEAVARLLPRSRLVVIPGAAHAVPYSAPLELGQVIKAFLTAVPGHAASPGVSGGTPLAEGMDSGVWHAAARPRHTIGGDPQFAKALSDCGISGSVRIPLIPQHAKLPYSSGKRTRSNSLKILPA
jgi:2-hydroxy-6-oxonona-2,4-dienedioate hydrolase